MTAWDGIPLTNVEYVELNRSSADDPLKSIFPNAVFCVFHNDMCETLMDTSQYVKYNGNDVIVHKPSNKCKRWTSSVNLPMYYNMD
jgi:hypothetical protein